MHDHFLVKVAGQSGTEGITHPISGWKEMKHTFRTEFYQEKLQLYLEFVNIINPLYIALIMIN